MSETLVRFIVGTLGAALIVTLARRRRALSPDGAIAAIVVGAVIVGAGGWWWGAVLLAFFTSSSALSRLRHERQPAVAARGAERDAVQVTANGGIPAIIAALGLITTGDLDAVRFACFVGAIAAVTADTWATEIGRFSRVAPRLITSGRVVAPGVSGGLTPLGTGASGAGALLIGSLAAAGAAAGWAVGLPWPLLLGTTGAGLTGSLLDSLLGATLQAGYRCPKCGQLTERTRHACGTTTELVRGRAWITNDMVNVAASLAGALVGGAVWLLTA
jgi:uncharacterized protein (TIGR00297 family)